MFEKKNVTTRLIPRVVVFAIYANPVWISRSDRTILSIRPSNSIFHVNGYGCCLTLPMLLAKSVTNVISPCSYVTTTFIATRTIKIY